MAILIRHAEESDVKTMAAIRARRWGTQDFWEDRIGRYLKDEYFPQQALVPRVAVVADNDGVVVGFAAGHQTRRFGCDGELEWIDVEEEHRRLGLAAKLLAGVGSWFVEHSLRRVCVNVDPGNTPARRFYAKCGAAPLSQQWMVWEDAQAMCGTVG